jgi:hypothetical protein
MGKFTGSSNVTRIFRSTPVAAARSDRYHIRFAIDFARRLRISYRHRRVFRHGRNCSPQLYVSQLAILTASEYNAATGVVINANLIKRLITPSGLAVLGNTVLDKPIEAR